MQMQIDEFVSPKAMITPHANDGLLICAVHRALHSL